MGMEAHAMYVNTRRKRVREVYSWVCVDYESGLTVVRTRSEQIIGSAIFIRTCLNHLGVGSKIAA